MKIILKVCKFGGSSVATANKIKMIKMIMDEDSNRRILVTSAIGKKSEDDTKLTDLLYLLAAHVKLNIAYNMLYARIKDVLIEIKNRLNINFDLESELNELYNHLPLYDENFIVSRGEYFTAKILSNYLGYQFVDAKDIICFDFDGNLNEKETIAKIKINCTDKKIVVPGFYGSYPNGKIKLLTRGGSDVTGAILSNALNAELYENFTDVSGVYVVDPKIIRGQKNLSFLSYNELRKLAYHGASVIHEDTIFPLLKNNIPLKICNMEDRHIGTLISSLGSNQKDILGIISKKNYIILKIEKNLTSKQKLLDYIYPKLFKYNIVMSHFVMKEDCVNIVIHKENATHIYDIIEELRTEKITKILVDEDVALISVICRNGNFSNDIMAVLSSKKENCKLFLSSENDDVYTIGVQNSDVIRVVEMFYNGLVDKIS